MQSALDFLSEVVLGCKKNRPVLVGIDGVDAAGKTTFADRLANQLAASKREIIRASIDGFHNPREVRYRKGKDSPRGYYEDSFNYTSVIADLMEPLSSGNLEYKTASFDYRTDSPVAAPARKASPNSVLVMDGIFLFRPALVRYWDIKVFLDVGFNISVSRAVARALASGLEEHSPQSAAEIRRAYDNRYIPGQKIYFRDASPREIADIVIDNTDFDNPKVTRPRVA